MPALHYYPVIGGIETWTKNIAEGISDRAEVFLVTGKVKGTPGREISGDVRIFRTSLFTLSDLSASPIVYTLHLLPFIFFKSLALIKKEKIDIIHCQGFLSSFIGFCLSKITGVPYMVTVQRIESTNFVKSMVYKNAALCIGASNAIRAYFKKIGVRNTEVIPNGIDLNKFKGLPAGRHDVFTVITVARLEKVKGIEYLIRAFAELVGDKHQDMKLVIVGDGSERKNLESLVSKSGVADKVSFLGEMPNERVPACLKGADCFVLPSLKEGFGIVLLEAQAAGIPVIASRVGGVPDIVEDGQTGILVEPRDPSAIAAAVLKIRSDAKERERLVKNANNNLSKYGWEEIANKVYESYISYGHISS